MDGADVPVASAKLIVQLCIDVISICKPYVCDNKLEGMSDNVKVGTVFGGDALLVVSCWRVLSVAYCALADERGAVDVDSDDDGGDDDGDDEFAFGSHIRVCAWRGVRESCLVLGAAMHKLMSRISADDVRHATDSLLSICLKVGRLLMDCAQRFLTRRSQSIVVRLRMRLLGFTRRAWRA